MGHQRPWITSRPITFGCMSGTCLFAVCPGPYLTSDIFNVCSFSMFIHFQRFNHSQRLFLFKQVTCERSEHCFLYKLISIGIIPLTDRTWDETVQIFSPTRHCVVVSNVINTMIKHKAPIKSIQFTYYNNLILCLIVYILRIILVNYENISQPCG